MISAYVIYGARYLVQAAVRSMALSKVVYGAESGRSYWNAIFARGICHTPQHLDHRKEEHT